MFKRALAAICVSVRIFALDLKLKLFYPFFYKQLEKKMLDKKLFMGFAVDPLFQKNLDAANPSLAAYFIRDSDEYLRETSYGGMKYLGKTLGQIATFSEAELLESNIYSLLKKLVPDFPYEESPLYLFPIK